MQRLTPLGWKDLLEPYAADHFLLVVPAAFVVFTLAASAWRLYSRREPRGAYLKLTNHSGSHLRTVGAFSLTLRLGRRRLLGWLVDVVTTATLIGSMTGSSVTLTKKNADYSDLLSKTSGGGEATSQVVSIFSVIVDVIIICESVNVISSLV